MTSAGNGSKGVDAPEDGYQRVLERRQAWTEKQLNGPLVIKGADRAFNVGRQGRLKYLLHPHLFDSPILEDWAVFIHEVGKASGRHTHQGGIILFVIQGTGYSIMNGVRYDWKAGDLIVMPLVKGGVEHQHFNTDPNQPAQWMAFRSYWIRNHIGSELDQKEDSSEWSDRQLSQTSTN